MNVLPERKVTFAEQSQAGGTNGTFNPLNLNGATDWSLDLDNTEAKQNYGAVTLGTLRLNQEGFKQGVVGPSSMRSTQGETKLNIPDISMVEIGDGFGESETEENWDETGTTYLSFESSMVQNDNIDSEDSLTVVDEDGFEGKRDC